MLKRVSGFLAMMSLLCGQAMAVEPDAPGPYAYSEFDTSYIDSEWGTFKATIFHPTDPSDGPFPGAVIASGWVSDKDAMDWVAKHLVTHGYVVLAFTPPLSGILNSAQWSAGFQKGIDTLIAQNEKFLGRISGLVDESKFAVLGLSAGGGGVLQAAAADSRIKAAVGFAPYNADSATREAPAKITAATQLQVGSLDILVPAFTVENLYDDLSLGPREYLKIDGASHSTFTNAGFETFHKISRRYFTAWLDYHLKNREESHTYIFGTRAFEDRDSGALDDLRFVESAPLPGTSPPPASGGCSVVGWGARSGSADYAALGVGLLWLVRRKRRATRTSNRA